MLELSDKKHEESIIELVEELFDVYEGNDWLTVKKYIVRYSHPNVRKHFTTRNPKTSKHTLNDFEKRLIAFCNNNYNKELTLSKKDMHIEKDKLDEA